ncbi:hypothetical protein KOW79_009691 [Hemibagrus wyckioides]|uniref:Uncharacterized protein n=1 Tax=Hemibagrus wyckioides TaxID=337641 RepID=A0A9D3NQ03_9TELE|nr:hypothetical protein KOW79_009691 [Hemibagrus wyckioides]
MLTRPAVAPVGQSRRAKGEDRRGGRERARGSGGGAQAGPSAGDFSLSLNETYERRRPLPAVQLSVVLNALPGRHIQKARVDVGPEEFSRFP